MLEDALTWLKAHASIFGTIFQGITSLGIVGFGLSYRKTRREERHRYYSRIQAGYFQFLQLVIAHPHLGAYVHGKDAAHLDENDWVRRAALYDILLSLFEDAYCDSRESPSLLRESWPGWEEHMREYLRKPSFLAHIAELGTSDKVAKFDDEFEAHLKELLQVESSQVDPNLRSASPQTRVG